MHCDNRMSTIRDLTARSAALTLAALLIMMLFAFGLPRSVQTAPGAVTATDDQVFISDATMLRVSDIATLAKVQDIAGSLGTSGGFDDGRHMVVDTVGERIFVSNHDSNFDVFDFSLTQLFPTWPGFLSEPLGIAPLPNGQLLITDEHDSVGLNRLNPDLTFVADTPDAVLFTAEGVAYDSVHDRVFVADEDDGDIEVFDGTTLAHIKTLNFTSEEGPYWLGVDGSSNHLFVLEVGVDGIHMFNILSGGDNLSFNHTLSGPVAGFCYSTLAVSESTDRLFAIDRCNDTVDMYDTNTVAFLGAVPTGRAGEVPLMVSVGRLRNLATPTPTPTPTPVARPVGGYGESQSSLDLLAPWMALVVVVVVGAVVVVLRRRMAL
ncbi:MAG: hypothetical protein ACE5F6_21500 [Anaerolineae bacterium]